MKDNIVEILVLLMLLAGLQHLQVAKGHHVKCERTFSKVDCFDTYQGRKRIFNELIVTDRDSRAREYSGIPIDWFHWEEYLHGFACRCATRLNKISSGNLTIYKQFAISNYGECWSSRLDDHYPSNLQRSNSCIGAGFLTCQSDNIGECTGTEYTSYLYQVNNRTEVLPDHCHKVTRIVCSSTVKYSGTTSPVSSGGTSRQHKHLERTRYSNSTAATLFLFEQTDSSLLKLQTLNTGGLYTAGKIPRNVTLAPSQYRYTNYVTPSLSLQDSGGFEGQTVHATKVVETLSITNSLNSKNKTVVDRIQSSFNFHQTPLEEIHSATVNYNVLITTKSSIEAAIGLFSNNTRSWSVSGNTAQGSTSVVSIHGSKQSTDILITETASRNTFPLKPESSIQSLFGSRQFFLSTMQFSNASLHVNKSTEIYSFSDTVRETYKTSDMETLSQYHYSDYVTSSLQDSGGFKGQTVEAIKTVESLSIPNYLNSKNITALSRIESSFNFHQTPLEGNQSTTMNYNILNTTKSSTEATIGLYSNNTQRWSVSGNTTQGSTSVVSIYGSKQSTEILTPETASRNTFSLKPERSIQSLFGSRQFFLSTMQFSNASLHVNKSTEIYSFSDTVRETYKTSDKETLMATTQHFEFAEHSISENVKNDRTRIVKASPSVYHLSEFQGTPAKHSLPEFSRRPQYTTQNLQKEPHMSTVYYSPRSQNETYHSVSAVGMSVTTTLAAHHTSTVHLKLDSLESVHHTSQVESYKTTTHRVSETNSQLDAIQDTGHPSSPEMDLQTKSPQVHDTSFVESSLESWRYLNMSYESPGVRHHIKNTYMSSESRHIHQGQTGNTIQRSPSTNSIEILRSVYTHESVDSRLISPISITSTTTPQKGKNQTSQYPPAANQKSIQYIITSTEHVLDTVQKATLLTPSKILGFKTTSLHANLTYQNTTTSEESVMLKTTLTSVVRKEQAMTTAQSTHELSSTELETSKEIIRSIGTETLNASTHLQSIPTSVTTMRINVISTTTMHETAATGSSRVTSRALESESVSPNVTPVSNVSRKTSLEIASVSRLQESSKRATDSHEDFSVSSPSSAKTPSASRSYSVVKSSQSTKRGSTSSVMQSIHAKIKCTNGKPSCRNTACLVNFTIVTVIIPLLAQSLYHYIR